MKKSFSNNIALLQSFNQSFNLTTLTPTTTITTTSDTSSNTSDILGSTQFFIHIICSSIFLLIGSLMNSLVLIALFKRQFYGSSIRHSISVWTSKIKLKVDPLKPIHARDNSTVSIPRNSSGGAHDVYLSNLAMADLISLAIMQPLSIINNYFRWPFGEFTCKFIYSAGNTVTAMSVTTFAALTLERYMAIVYPIRTHNIGKKTLIKRAKIIVVLTWIVSYCLTSLPLSFYLSVGPSSWSTNSCQLHWPNVEIRNAYHLFVFIVLYIIPIVISTICLIAICFQMGKSRTLYMKSCSTTSNYQTKSPRLGRKLEMALISLLFCFIICMSPMQIFLIMMCYCEEILIKNHTVSRTIYQFCYQLVFANSAINPIVLILMSADIRTAIMNNLNCFHF